jgi:hypothetical protein
MHWLLHRMEGSESRLAATTHAYDFGPTTNHEICLEFTLEGLLRLGKPGRRHGRPRQFFEIVAVQEIV